MWDDLIRWILCAQAAAFYPINQRLVRRKGLDHRPYFVPSLWGLLGFLIISMASPRGWRRFP